MLPVLFGLAVAAMVVASPFAFRRLSRVRRAAGAAVVPLVRHQAARGMAVPVQPGMTGPYAYDDGVLTGRPDEEEQ